MSEESNLNDEYNDDDPSIDDELTVVNDSRRNCCCCNFTCNTKNTILIILGLSLIASLITSVVLSSQIAQIVEPIFIWFNPRKYEILPLALFMNLMWVILVIPFDFIWPLSYGFFYGLLYGYLIAIFSGTFNSMIAFLISRYIFKVPLKKCSKCCNKNKPENETDKYDELFQYLSQNYGFWFVLAIRLFIVPPDTWTNHIMAHTDLSFLTFISATFIGKILWLFLKVYIGSEFHNLFDFTAALHHTKGNTFTFVFSGIMLLFCFIIAVGLTYKSKQWLDAKKQEYKSFSSMKIDDDEMNQLVQEMPEL